jgi:hypothetical protein
VTIRWARTLPAIAGAILAGVALLAGAHTAAADIAVTNVHPPVGTPGENVALRVGCGGCPPRGLRLPVSLVPVEDRPRPELCGQNAVCSARATSPPKRRPFTFLGRTSRSGQLRFAVPEVKPGAYAFVIYCASCYRGTDGSLISNDEQGDLLRVRAESRTVAGASARPSGFLRAAEAVWALTMRLLTSVLR